MPRPRGRLLGVRDGNVLDAWRAHAMHGRYRLILRRCQSGVARVVAQRGETAGEDSFALRWVTSTVSAHGATLHPLADVLRAALHQQPREDHAVTMPRPPCEVAEAHQRYAFASEQRSPSVSVRFVATSHLIDVARFVLRPRRGLDLPRGRSMERADGAVTLRTLHTLVSLAPRVERYRQDSPRRSERDALVGCRLARDVKAVDSDVRESGGVDAEGHAASVVATRPCATLRRSRRS